MNPPLPWREIARVMGWNTTTVFGWVQRYATEGEAGLVSRKPGRSYLLGRTLTLAQEWVLRTILTSQTPSKVAPPKATGRPPFETTPCCACISCSSGSA